jgi:hypothetical protein
VRLSRRGALGANRAAPNIGVVNWSVTAEPAVDQEWASVTAEPYSTGATTDTVGFTYPTPATTDVRGTLPSRLYYNTTFPYQGTRCYVSRVQNGDNAFNERAELGMALPHRTDTTWTSGPDRLWREGQTHFMAFAIRTGDGYPNQNTWHSVVQYKQVGNMGTPVLNLELRTGYWRWVNSAGNVTEEAATVDLASIPIVPDVWALFLTEVKFSPDPAVGYIRVLADNRDGGGVREMLQKTFTHTQKLNTDGSAGSLASLNAAAPSALRFGQYRDSAITAIYELFFDSFVDATTQYTAAMNAFTGADATAFANF